MGGDHDVCSKCGGLRGQKIRGYGCSKCNPELNEMPTDPTLPKILSALNMPPGSTVEQVVAEVRKMRQKIRNVYVYLDTVPLENPAEGHFQAIHNIIRPIGDPVPQPLGQGVEALLPEHGEAKQ